MLRLLAKDSNEMEDSICVRYFSEICNFLDGILMENSLDLPYAILSYWMNMSKLENFIVFSVHSLKQNFRSEFTQKMLYLKIIQEAFSRLINLGPLT